MPIRLFRDLEKELGRLRKLEAESNSRKILDFEKKKEDIASIFERVNEARVRFQVRPAAVRLPTQD